MLNVTKYKKIDTSLKDASFKDDHYCAFFDYLVGSCPIEDDADGVAVYVSENAKNRAGNYLDANDLMPAWVDEHYEILAPDTASEREVEFRSIKELHADFRTSATFQTLSRREQRGMNESKFRGAIKKSARFKGKYREAKKVRLSDGKYNDKDGLVDVQKKPE